jgi:hypothetical protein
MFLMELRTLLLLLLLLYTPTAVSGRNGGAKVERTGTRNKQERMREKSENKAGKEGERQTQKTNKLR